MFGLSLGHLIIVLVVLLLFGARRLPELGGALGKGLRSFKKGLDGSDDQPERLEPPAGTQQANTQSSNDPNKKS